VKVNDIKEKRFQKGNIGYNVDEVDRFMKVILADYETYDKQLETIKEKMQLLVVTVQKYKQDEESLRREKEAIGTAMTKALSVEQEATDIANEKADVILAKARETAEILIGDAKEEAKRIVASARANYDNIIEETKQEAEMTKQTLTNLKQEVSNFKKNMFAIYKEHIDIISQLPSVEKEEKAAPAKTAQNGASEETKQISVQNTDERRPEPIREPVTHEPASVNNPEEIDNIIEEFSESENIEMTVQEHELLSVDDVLDNTEDDDNNDGSDNFVRQINRPIAKNLTQETTEIPRIFDDSYKNADTGNKHLQFGIHKN
jgi:cell division initiation protein